MMRVMVMVLSMIVHRPNILRGSGKRHGQEGEERAEQRANEELGEHLGSWRERFDRLKVREK